MEVRATRRATVAPSVSTLLCGNEEIQKMHRRQQLPQTEPALLKTNVKFLRRISHDLLVPVICHRLCITVGTAALVCFRHGKPQNCGNLPEGETQLFDGTLHIQPKIRIANPSTVLCAQCFFMWTFFHADGKFLRGPRLLVESP